MKIGDYVRTEEGISKIKKYEYDNDYENCHLLYFENKDYGVRYSCKDLLKSSPRIIDLIESGE